MLSPTLFVKIVEPTDINMNRTKTVGSIPDSLDFQILIFMNPNKI